MTFSLFGGLGKYPVREHGLVLSMNDNATFSIASSVFCDGCGIIDDVFDGLVLFRGVDCQSS